MGDGKKISVIYEKNKNHITAPITGVWGGLSPDLSHINASFFLDQQVIPSYENIAVDQTTNELDLTKIDNVSRGDLVREIFATISLSSATARVIAGWLIQHADLLDNRRKERNEL